MKRSKNQRPNESSARWIFVGLFCITFLVYLPSLGAGFIEYFDDNQYIIFNQHINHGFTLAGLAWLPTGIVVANWHPLTNLTHMFDAQCFGLNPWGHHLTSVLLHATATVLLFHLLRTLTQASWRSAFVAALFALHPTHVESVTWVAERKDVLSACLWFLTTLAYVRYTRTPNARRYALVIFLFALALTSKVMVVTLPFTLLLLDYWPLSRLACDGRSPASLRRFGMLFLEKMPLFFLSAGAAAITAVVQRGDATVKSLDLFPMSLRLENAITSYASYLFKLVWFADLSFYYPLVQPKLYQWLGALILVTAITVATLWQIRRRPYLFVGWFWFLGTLVPVIQIVQTGSHAMADRYGYVPSIGVFIMAVWLVAELVIKVDFSKRLVATVAASTLGVLSISTYIQQGYWKDSETLFRRALDVTKDNAMPNYLLGALYLGRGRLDEAERRINEGIRIFPDPYYGYYNLGSVKYIQHDYVKAVELFVKAGEAGVAEGVPYFWAGKAFDRMGRTEEAETQYRNAVREYEKARSLNPTSASIAVNLGVVLERLGKPQEALTHYEEAARLDPSLTTAQEAVTRLRAAGTKTN